MVQFDGTRWYMHGLLRYRRRCSLLLFVVLLNRLGGTKELLLLNLNYSQVISDRESFHESSSSPMRINNAS